MSEFHLKFLHSIQILVVFIYQLKMITHSVLNHNKKLQLSITVNLENIDNLGFSTYSIVQSQPGQGVIKYSQVSLKRAARLTTYVCS